MWIDGFLSTVEYWHDILNWRSNDLYHPCDLNNKSVVEKVLNVRFVQKRNKQLTPPNATNKKIDLPISMRLTAFALASSSAVTHLCLSTSLLAFRWNVCVPPLLITKLHESSVWMNALARLMVPRHVWDISAWFLTEKNPKGIS